MKLNIVVLMKQVPDTRYINGGTLQEDGTINRAALPSIINPDDLVALEQALQLKDLYPTSCVTVLTMGLPSAQQVVREALFRGADKGYVLSDVVFAGSDTLATAKVLSRAILQLGKVDLVLAGQQTLDGDTAHVGPQVACLLNWAQITAAVSVQSSPSCGWVVKRMVDNGMEIVSTKGPMVVTMNVMSMKVRPYEAKRMMLYKNANVAIWDASFLGIDEKECGIHGSCTQVVSSQLVEWKKKEQVILQANEVEMLWQGLTSNGIII